MLFFFVLFFSKHRCLKFRFFVCLFFTEEKKHEYFLLLRFLLLLFTTVLPRWDFSSTGNSDCFPQGKPAATESRYPSPVHAGCLSVSLIHRSLIWTKGSLKCAQMLMHAIAHGGVRTQKESLH